MDDQAGLSPPDDSGYGSSGSLRTHPDKFDFEHVQSLKVFTEDLGQALKGAFPRSTDAYTAVHVLLLRWADDDLQVQSEIDQLRRVFDRQFHFETEEWQIPSSSNPTRSLQNKLFEYQDAHQSESELLIVYYAGHGEADRRGRSIWRANQREDSPSLIWSSLQPLLENAIPHVLIVLDCCFAANAARDTTQGTTKEILAACGRENPTLGVGIRSFTSALIEELRDFGDKPFTVAMLHSRLVTMRWRLAFTPIYALLSEGGGNSIRLAPLLQTEASSVEGLGESGTGFSEDESMDRMDFTPDVSLSAETRVLLAVSVSQSAPVDVAQWHEWLTTQAPSHVTGIDVRLESVFVSHSFLAIVSVPMYAWTRLRETTAYHFIGFIKSNNILPGLQARVNVATQVSQTSEMVGAVSRTGLGDRESNFSYDSHDSRDSGYSEGTKSAEANLLWGPVGNRRKDNPVDAFRPSVPLRVISPGYKANQLARLDEKTLSQRDERTFRIGINIALRGIEDRFDEVKSHVFAIKSGESSPLLMFSDVERKDRIRRGINSMMSGLNMAKDELLDYRHSLVVEGII